MSDIEHYTNDDDNNKAPKFKSGLAFLILFVLVWVIAGFIAHLYAIVCIGEKGAFKDKMIGLLLAIFLGPFYWIYYYTNKSYCGRS